MPTGLCAVQTANDHAEKNSPAISCVVLTSMDEFGDRDSRPDNMGL